MPHPDTSLERFADFSEQCAIELRLIGETVTELEDILSEIHTSQIATSLRNRAAAANFSQSFYNGVENILRRTSKYCDVPLPKSEQWHSELAERFTSEYHSAYHLPLLLPPAIVTQMKILRRFRHLIMHGYAMNLDWERMRLNVELIPITFPIFRTAVEEYIARERQQISS
jgi:hypothetical protein